MDSKSTYRENCWRCFHSQATCYCHKVSSFSTEAIIAVLVHPREARNQIGTARIVKLSIENSLLIVGRGPELDQDERIQEILLDPDFYPVVLYPGPDALELNGVAVGELGAHLPKDKKLVVFVVDGTWRNARHMIRTSRILTGLPKISFTREKASSYRIRMQPKAVCVSTVEAVHEVLERLDQLEHSRLPEGRPHDGLLNVFDWMVELQIDYKNRFATPRT